ncbi:putative secreted protein [Propionispora sp. 2/2-37]|uniref:DUF4127 family protein n=1 Tax=Propionispora sp. 2/2-37 TaxID=1677858 RepID=UPI0006BB6462|nr:DUF4127 family protein [Propionispora sp. 2/2-37]CUH96546.1 putative secreted protein [Propionispora sp. 2/2-37]
MKQVIKPPAWSKRAGYKIVMLSLLLILVPAVASAKTILYVPADDRPVSLQYVVETVKAANYEIILPPVEFLAGRGHEGRPEVLWQWVRQCAPQADALVLSADTLLYGGLVNSRTHNIPIYGLEERLQSFRQLKKENPHIPIFVFATVMRSPQRSSGGMEPSYYEQEGNHIFWLTALQDEAQCRQLTPDKQNRLTQLQTVISEAHLNDWLSRRTKNYRINAELIGLVGQEAVDYLILGRDDAAPFSQSHREWRQLAQLAAALPSEKYASFPGADQLGMILLTRACNQLSGKRPAVKILYAAGAGPGTVASYEDQPVGRTVAEHIIAAGGVIIQEPQEADLVLAVNTPLSGRTEEADDFSNYIINRESTGQLLTLVEQTVSAGIPVAVADIAFANGADNSLLQGMFTRRLLDKVAAYSGWNTASNTLGYAIGQGMLAPAMTDKDRKRLLAVRYLDDWAYQANVRKEICLEVLYPNQGKADYLNWLAPQIANRVEHRLQLFCRSYLWLDPDDIQVAFPWNRMFELDVKVGK